MKEISILKQYIQNVSKYPRITPDEEVELAEKIKKGDRKAFEKLVNSNLKLVVKIAMQLCHSNSNLMDVIQNGNIGLIKAADKFDPTRGVKFSTYSAFWIKQSIMRGFIKTNSGVNISYRKDEINKKIKNYIREYFLKSSQYPSVEVIVNELNVKRADAIDGLTSHKKANGAGTAGVAFEGNDEFLDTIPDNRYNPESILEKKTLSEEIHRMIESFPDRENEIIRKRFGFQDAEKTTLTEIGKKYSITAEATRQIEKRTLTLMKEQHPSLAAFYYSGFAGVSGI